MIDKEFEDKIVFISGGSSGLGRVLTEKFLDSGSKVFLTYYNSEKEAKELEKKYNKNVCSIKTDLTDTENIPAVVNSFKNFSDSINIFIHNASAFNTVKDIDKLINIHYTSAVLILKKLFTFFNKKEDNLAVFISDIFALRPMKKHLPYIVSKSIIIENIKELSRILSEKNVRVNAVCPGIINLHKDIDTEKEEKIINKIFLKRKGGYKDISNFIFLLYRDLTYINGKIISIDGARSIYI